MDPISHTLLTLLVVGRRRDDLLAGLAPDLPWYALYPAWVLRGPQRRAAARSGAWPMPPRWLQQAHYASHSLILLAVLWAAARGTGRSTRWTRAWLLHLLLDVPTHARQRLAPRLLWPLSHWAYDGLSWADHLTRLIMPQRNTERRARR